MSEKILSFIWQRFGDFHMLNFGEKQQFSQLPFVDIFGLYKNKRGTWSQ